MNWQRSGEVGMIAEPYRVGKFLIDCGAHSVKYGLWYEREHLGYFQTFEQAQESAEAHKQAQPESTNDL